MLGGPARPGPGAGAPCLHSSAAASSASSASPAPAGSGAERSGAPPGSPGLGGLRASGGSRRRLAPSPSSPPAALSSGFFYFILFFPPSRLAAGIAQHADRPLAGAMERHRGGAHGDGGERGGCGDPHPPFRVSCSPSAPGSETSLVPQSRRGPGGIRAAPRCGDGHGVRAAARLCWGGKRGARFVVKGQPVWPLT